MGYAKLKELGLTEGLNTSLNSAQYHGLRGTYSSSQLKDALKDIEYFHAKHILHSVESEHITAFDIGTYFHTAILEPHLIETECAVYKGVRRGKEWDSFKAVNEGKAIITESEYYTALMLVNAVKNSPIAMARLGRGSPEVSAFVVIRVVGTDIYAPTYNKALTKNGWEDCKSVPKNGLDIVLKTRADLLADHFILDLKSMTGNAKDRHGIKAKISELSYDLSAAMYLDIFSLASGIVKTEFVWTFASKQIGNCKNYIASVENILVGRAKWKKAVLEIAEGMSHDWDLPDVMDIIEPNHYELDILRESSSSAL